LIKGFIEASILKIPQRVHPAAGFLFLIVFASEFHIQVFKLDFI
jgi:hypothetical protein